MTAKPYVDNSDNSDRSDNSTYSSAEALKDGVAANGGGKASVDNSVSLGAIAVNTSVLGSTVADNQTTVDGWKSEQSAANDVAGSFEGAAGINVAAQNLGQSAAVQQSVNVQANLH